jgi:CRISPR-associated protein Csx17
MTEPIILYGCSPEPLIQYLKALGILRLVAEQLDPQARGAWNGDAFVLTTTRSRDELIDFFFTQYRPTPLISPWNGGSGFYDGDDASARDAIRTSDVSRLEKYRGAINSALALPELPSVGHLTIKNLMAQVEQAVEESKNQESKEVIAWRTTVAVTKKGLADFSQTHDLGYRTVEELEGIKISIPERDERRKISELLQSVKKLRGIVKKFKRAAGKDDIIKACRNHLDDSALEWSDAAVVLFENESGEAPLLGVGGIDGKFEFARNFMSRLCTVLPEIIEINSEARQQRELEKNSESPVKLAKVRQQIAELSARAREKSLQNLKASLFAEGSPFLEKAAVGQFQPSAAGGAPNASNSPKIDSSEGMVNPWDFILAMEGSLLMASSTVRQLAAGARTKASFPFTVRTSNIGYGTAVAGEKTRAEVWLPLWSRFCGYAEVARIFREGRVQFSHRRKAVRTGFDFARAVAELGVDRGIESFQRYAFIERNGQANLATPLGQFEVRERPRAGLIHQVDGWLDAFSRAASGDKVPPRFARALQRIENSIFRLCESGSQDHLLEVLVSLGFAETELANGEKFRAEKMLRPLKGLGLAWATECKDGSEEFSLAASLSSIHGDQDSGSIRENIEAVEVKEGTVAWAGNSVRAVWTNASLAENLANVLQRRSVDARMIGLAHPVLTSSRFSALETLSSFLNNEIDDGRIEDLLKGLILIDWQKVEFESELREQPFKIPSRLPRAYALLKLLFLPKGRLRRNEYSEIIVIKHEPAIVPLLQAGRVSDAIKIASQRLRSSGLTPLTEQFVFDDTEGTRLAAALLIPIAEPSVRALANLTLRDTAKDS